MAKKKVQYEVLVACSNGRTNKWFKIGDVVKAGDFPIAVIKNWLEIKPPVLRLL